MRIRAFRRAPVEQEVDDELAFHLEMTTRELMEQGMTRSQARTEAERRFGDAAVVNEECRRFGRERERNERRAEYRDELRQDVWFATRQLLKAKSFTAIAVLTLALGIGATAAVFSVLDAVVLRPLPFANPDRVVTLNPSRHGEAQGNSVPDFLAWRKVRELEVVAAAVVNSGITMNVGETPELIPGGRVTADFFGVFGVKPILGRTFTVADDVPGAANVVVISHRLWVSHFNGNTSTLGRSIQLDGKPHTVIGVLPASFDYTRGNDQLWVPIAFTPDQATRYSERFLEIVARLAPGVTIDQARASTTAAERALVEQVPERGTTPISDFAAEVHRFVDEVVGDYRALFLILLGAVGFVLLIACTNVANLLLARGSARAKELAIRAALGAGRARLVRQLLTEALVLAVAGALGGLAVAYGLVRFVVAIGPEGIPRLEHAGVDWRVLAFTLALAVLSSVLFGLLPALRSAGPRIQGTLREGGRGSAMGRDRLRGTLVAAEVALAITLLVGSGLLIRSAWLMQRVDPGFNPKGVLTARVVLPGARYPNGEAVVRAYTTIRENAARIPGVSSASLASVVPMSGSDMESSIRTEEQPAAVGKAPQANLRIVSGDYFRTMGIPLRIGRDLTLRDDGSAPLVVVVNEALAKKLWPTLALRDVIGRRMNALSWKKDEPHYMSVVGIVADIHDAGLNQPVLPEFYVPFAQTPEMLWPLIQRSLEVVIKSASGSVSSLVRPLRRAVAAADPSLPLADAEPMEDYLAGSLRTARMNTLLLSTLGAIALALAMVGIYGVVSYFVTQRTQEIGVRMALGATPALIWRFVIRRGMGPIVVGLVLGLGLSVLTTTVLRGQLYRITTHDPLTFGAVGGVLLAVAMLATYLPARRAMRVPPVVALTQA